MKLQIIQIPFDIDIGLDRRQTLGQKTGFLVTDQFLLQLSLDLIDVFVDPFAGIKIASPL